MRPADENTGRCDKHAVYVPKPRKPRVKPPLEKTVVQAIREALLAEGCWVKVHIIVNRNFKHTGLGD